MYNYFLVLIYRIGVGYNALSPSIAPAVEIDGITAGVFADIDAVTVVGAVMLLRVRQGVRGRIRGRHAAPRCSACAAPKDKAHHTKDAGRG